MIVVVAWTLRAHVARPRQLLLLRRDGLLLAPRALSRAPLLIQPRLVPGELKVRLLLLRSVHHATCAIELAINELKVSLVLVDGVSVDELTTTALYCRPQLHDPARHVVVSLCVTHPT
jgi:hypothetical protein